MRAPLLAVPLLFTTATVAQHAILRVPESAEPVRISLRSGTRKDVGFTSITINANGRAITFHPRNATACVPATKEERMGDISWAGINGMKLDSSLCFYVGQFGTDVAKHTLLAFVGEGGASDAAPVFIIGFDTSGTPYKALERGELDLTSLISREDGSALVAGKPTLSQVMAPLNYDPHKDAHATTYDPFAVYVVTPGNVAVYSLEESRKYNLEHYVWAGPKSSESYLVFYNIPGHAKPFGAKKEEANALLARAGQDRKQ
jgi:hypothetical protein